ncbi:MAG: cytochrome c [Candidatus Acidiferrum sp.]|jgi:mono/diheme cytochrome c family protein
MKLSFPALGGFLLVPFLCLAWQQNSFQPKPQDNLKETQSAATDRKNPVKPTPENLAEAKKFFGYDCAMCHGADGDGKGDLAASMGLKMNDWRNAATLSAMPDGEIFDLIEKGKGKMTGEGDRVSSEMAWKLVNYVRSFAKKDTAATPKPEASL